MRHRRLNHPRATAGYRDLLDVVGELVDRVHQLEDDIEHYQLEVAALRVGASASPSAPAVAPPPAPAVAPPPAPAVQPAEPSDDWTDEQWQAHGHAVALRRKAQIEGWHDERAEFLELRGREREYEMQIMEAVETARQIKEMRDV